MCSHPFRTLSLHTHTHTHTHNTHRAMWTMRFFTTDWLTTSDDWRRRRRRWCCCCRHSVESVVCRTGATSTKRTVNRCAVRDYYKLKYCFSSIFFFYRNGKFLFAIAVTAPRASRECRLVEHRFIHCLDDITIVRWLVRQYKYCNDWYYRRTRAFYTRARAICVARFWGTDEKICWLWFQ